MSAVVCSDDTRHALIAAYAEWSIATDISRGAREMPSAPTAALQRRYAARLLDITTADLKRARDTCRREFGALRDWSWRPLITAQVQHQIQHAGFADYYDHPYIDHAEVYYQTGKVIGLVTHAYATFERVQVYATEYGLICEALEFSWYSPQGTIAAVLTPTVRR